MRNVASFQTQLDRLKGRREQVELNQASTQNLLTDIEAEQQDLEVAQAIVQTVAKATQEELEYHVSELVSLALEAVFPEPYKLGLDFELRRGKTEADLYFIDPEEPDVKIDPLSGVGGGVVDVASWGLRVACWSLKTNRTRPTVVMDEPFRFLSSDLQEKASVMLKELSDRLGIQFIIVTHEAKLIEGKVDRTFEISQRKGVSFVVGQKRRSRRTK